MSNFLKKDIVIFDNRINYHFYSLINRVDLNASISILQIP